MQPHDTTSPSDQQPTTGHWNDPEFRKAYYRARYAARGEHRDTTRRQEWRLRNADKLREQRRAWREAHKEEKRLYDSNWRKNHPTYHSEWITLHGPSTARANKWKKSHPEAYKASVALTSYRRRSQGAPSHIPRVLGSTIYSRDKGICAICGKKVPFKHMSLDHILPISFGGFHVASNLQLAHKVCNIRRGNRGPAQLRLPL